MSRIRIATFNTENLFARYRFNRYANPERAVIDGWLINETRFSVHKPSSKKVTGEAIMAANAHVIALQEIESLDVLKKFRTDFLGGRATYPHAVLVDSNDPRRIDVALLSKFPITHVRSYQHLRTANNRAYIFSRDCLEADVRLDSGQSLTLFVNHLKSMIGGRANTKDRRHQQSLAVIDIVKDRFGPNAGDGHDFVILGDLNDYVETGHEDESGISNLVGWPGVVDVIGRLPQAERWTHHWNGGDEYRQLDYILVSKSLADRNPNALPEMERRGMSARAAQAGPNRFPGVTDIIKASDHCPVTIELEL